MQRVELFSTADMSPRERVPFWNEITKATIGPITVAPLDPATFSASVTRVKLADMELVVPVSGPAKIQHVHPALEPALLNLQVQLTGRSWHRTCGHEGVLEAGDFALFDPSRPFQMRFDEMTRVILVRLPVGQANERMPGLSDLVGVPMRGRTATGSLLSSFLRDAWSQIEMDDAEDWVSSLSDVIWPLIDLAYQRQRQPAASLTGRRVAMRARAAAFIEGNLTEPDLGVAAIADELGVTTRYVQLLFAELLTTPTRFIQARRLETAADLLRKHGAAASVTNIAFDVGFGDLSTFCHAFRRRFGVTPRDFRAGLRRSAD